MKPAKQFLTLVLALALILPVVVGARIGVGVETGKIRLEQELKTGQTHTLPVVKVVNTGDEPSDYVFSIQYHSGQEQREDMGLAPPADWFSFTPETFYLEPDQRQSVEISLHLPKNARPGKYFAYLEGQPTKKVKGQGSGVSATIGVAAASQLWFTIVPANTFQKIYWAVISFYALYRFWINLAAGIIFAVIVVAILRRLLRFNIGLRR